jgi:hypothetical protein
MRTLFYATYEVKDSVTQYMDGIAELKHQIELSRNEFDGCVDYVTQLMYNTTCEFLETVSAADGMNIILSSLEEVRTFQNQLQRAHDVCKPIDFEKVSGFNDTLSLISRQIDTLLQFVISTHNNNHAVMVKLYQLSAGYDNNESYIINCPKRLFKMWAIAAPVSHAEYICRKNCINNSIRKLKMDFYIFLTPC